MTTPPTTSQAPCLFRAIWPITDPTRPFLALCQEAYTDLAELLLQAHAHPTGHGRFTAAPSAHIPGSGRITDWVLIYECPATSRPRALPNTRTASSTNQPTTQKRGIAA